MGNRRTAKDVDEYIGWFAPDVQEKLERIRQAMHEAAPGADERIAYAIPSLTLNERPLVYFAAFRNHISVYPAPRGDGQFAAELEQYAGGKGTVQFPVDQPIPYDLVRRIVKYRLAQADHRRRTKQSEPAGGEGEVTRADEPARADEVTREDEVARAEDGGDA